VNRQTVQGERVTAGPMPARREATSKKADATHAVYDGCLPDSGVRAVVDPLGPGPSRDLVGEDAEQPRSRAAARQVVAVALGERGEEASATRSSAADLPTRWQAYPYSRPAYRS